MKVSWVSLTDGEFSIDKQSDLDVGIFSLLQLQ